MSWTQAWRLLGAAMFGGSLALLGRWWTTTASHQEVLAGPMAAVGNTLLFSGFALHHSVLARAGAKDKLAQIVPPDLLRTAYVCTASALLAAMCVAWVPLGGVAFRLAGIAALSLRVVQVTGIVIGVAAVRRISVRELAGLGQPAARDAELQLDGPYRLVRHPLYLAWVLVVWASPLMTRDRLLFASLSSAYLLLAMPFEEAGLIRQFGARYLEYRQMVRWRLIPYIH